MNRVTFIAIREADYSRVSIVRQGLRKEFHVDEYLSGRNSYPGRIVEICLRIIWAWVTGRLRNSDVVVVGFFAQPIFPLVRILFRGPIVSDAYFSIFDTMVHDKKKVTSTSILGRLCYWLDRHMLRRSQMCLTDTKTHACFMQDFFNVEDAAIRRLWIGAEGKPLEHLTESVEPGTTFEVCFWGGFIPLQGIETILRAAALVKDERIRFTLIGAGQTYEPSLQLAEQLKLENVEFKGWQDRAFIDDQVSRAHLALGIFGTTPKAGRVIPNKAFEALLMGIPLITRRSPAVDELLEDNKTCLLVEEGNPVQLAEKILWARDNYTKAREIASSGQELFARECSVTKIGAQLVYDVQSAIAGRSEANLEGHAQYSLETLKTKRRDFRKAASNVDLR